MKFSLSRFVEIVDRLGPAVLSVVPGGDKIAPVVPKILDGIKAAQAIKGASGADKKKHVLEIVAASAGAVNATGKAHVDATELEAIAGRAIDTVVEAVHVVEGAKATRPGEAAAPGVEVGGIAGTVPGVDTAPTSSDLGGGHASHGHGSADNVKPGKTPNT